MNQHNINPRIIRALLNLDRRSLLKGAFLSTTTAAAAIVNGRVGQASNTPSLPNEVIAYQTGTDGAIKRSLEDPTERIRLPFRQGERNWLTNIVNWYEFPTNDPNVLEVWAYTDKLSYKPGDEVALHVNTTASNYDIEIFRDGGTMQSVLKQKGIPGAYHETPIECYESGCNWPVSKTFRIPSNWKSGGYVVVLSVEKDGKRIEHEAFFILRPASLGSRTKILFMPAIPTWIAYNDFGGGCSYRLPPEAGGGGREARETSYAINTSTHKPWPRGFIRLPKVAVNAAQAMTEYNDRPIGWEPAYPNLDYSFANGYSMFCSFAGWAAYDRHFAIWAEQAGYEIDYASMHDIYDIPNLLENYNVIVQVGHDEYHTYDYRQALDKHLARGGNIMRVGGNLLWKVRWEGDKNRQVYFKHGQRKKDPAYANSADRKYLTVGWHHFESPTENPVTTWGVNGHKGVYAHVGGATPRGSGGFTIYRNKHWVFEGTDLYYGDVLGGIGNVPLVGFEVDGVDYTFRHGLPYPTGEDEAPKTLEILALAPALAAEETDHGHPREIIFYGDRYDDARETALDLNIEPTQENLEKMIYGNCAMTYMRQGKGEVFGAGTCNWVIKLLEGDPFVDRITKNVLDRFSA